MFNTDNHTMIVCPTAGCGGRAFINRRPAAGLPPVWCGREQRHMEMPPAPVRWDGSQQQQGEVVNALVQRELFAEMRRLRAEGAGDGRAVGMMPGAGAGMIPAVAATPAPVVNAAALDARIDAAVKAAVAATLATAAVASVVNAAPAPAPAPARANPHMLRDGETARGDTIYGVDGKPRATINRTAQMRACSHCGTFEPALVQGHEGRAVCAVCKRRGW